MQNYNPVALFEKKYDTLFHSLKFKEFKPRFAILCKGLESKISKNRGILLEGTQKLVRIKEISNYRGWN